MYDRDIGAGVQSLWNQRTVVRTFRRIVPSRLPLQGAAVLLHPIVAGVRLGLRTGELDVPVVN